MTFKHKLKKNLRIITSIVPETEDYAEKKTTLDIFKFNLKKITDVNLKFISIKKFYLSNTVKTIMTIILNLI